MFRPAIRKAEFKLKKKMEDSRWNLNTSTRVLSSCRISGKKEEKKHLEGVFACK